MLLMGIIERDMSEIKNREEALVSLLSRLVNKFMLFDKLGSSGCPLSSVKSQCSGKWRDSLHGYKRVQPSSFIFCSVNGWFQSSFMIKACKCWLVRVHPDMIEACEGTELKLLISRVRR
ncbi:hypothetical protein AKJ16_DCAP21701 [Drosera capensis]